MPAKKKVSKQKKVSKPGILSSGWIPTGIIKGESNEYYHSVDNRISSTMLKTALKDPQEFVGKYILKDITMKSDSTAFKLGNVFEQLLENEPIKYPDIYCVAPKVDKRTKAGKEEFASFSSQVGDRYILTHEEDKLMADMLDGAFSNEYFSSIMENCKPEFQTVFRYKSGPYYLQCRNDILIEECISIPELGINQGDRVVLDIKTSKDSLEWAKKNIIDYRYDIQDAFYRQVMAKCGHPPKHFLFAFAPKVYPYKMQLVKVPEYIIEMAKSQVISALNNITSWYAGRLPQVDKAVELDFTDYELKKMGLIEG